MRRKKPYMDEIHKTTPVTITYKFYNDTVIMKRDVYDLTIRDLMELNRSMVVNVFDEQLYQEYIIQLAEELTKKKNPFKNFIERILK
jgi:hypothetical protein